VSEQEMGRRCPWCWIRTTRRGFPHYGRLWSLWRRGRYCSMCAPPPSSRAGRLAIAHNAISTEIRRLHADVMALAAPPSPEREVER